MGEKKKQRSDNIQKRYRRELVNLLFRQDAQDKYFVKLVRTGFFKEIKDGQSESVHL